MKYELLGSASVGLFGVAGSWLIANGSSWPMVLAALLGAAAAVLDLSPWGVRKALLLLLFNTIVGAFGVPIALHMFKQDLSMLPLGASFLLPFLVGWVAHSFFSEFREPFITIITKFLGKLGGAK
ncbi:hypothetical protein J7400_18790 [Shimia sp. R9_2]|uniref:hypothetical protein n=1 Tax=Shimia sp. R9_2 TaxID=2821112 RepID=UPI001ADD1BC5|nr:hypothetical protein [Shimia sp. R9_2]MBO9398725.1 hypothetical protein [Shimia sp. R9_2]